LPSQHLKGLSHATLSGLPALGVAYPARILLAVSEGQSLKGSVRGRIPSEGTGERFRYVDLTAGGVKLDRDFDGVSRLGASHLAYRAIQAQQSFAVHGGHRRAPAVAVDRRADWKAFRALSDGRNLLVIENNRGGGAARHERRGHPNGAARP